MMKDMERFEFKFIRNWCGYEIWELNDKCTGIVEGTIEVKKTTNFYSIFSMHVKTPGKGYGSFMYSKVEEEAKKKNCRWIIGEWAEIYEGNINFIQKLMKEGFRQFTEEDKNRTGIQPKHSDYIIKELIF